MKILTMFYAKHFFTLPIFPAPDFDYSYINFIADTGMWDYYVQCNDRYVSKHFRSECKFCHVPSK